MSESIVLSVEHFRNVIESETKSLNLMCDKWSKVLADPNNASKQGDFHENNKGDPSREQKDKTEEQELKENQDKNEQEEFLGAIRTTIGQAKLLMSQRFKQFSKLIDDCEFMTSPLPTRLEDLAGFWEMISFQVDDVRQKFSSLEKNY